MAAFNCGHFFIFIYIHIIYLMRTIDTYINEKLRLSAKQKYTCQPKSKDELQQIILQRIKGEGNECDLNDIDVSQITDMSFLFYADNKYGGNEIFEQFNGDISMWNVSNVKDMTYIFGNCHEFNCDISQWDVSNVTIMKCMFYKCVKFNCDLSTWNVSNVKHMNYMFSGCKNFDCDLSMWDVSNVKSMHEMFNGCKQFNCDLSKWNVSNVKNIDYMFKGCEKFKQDLDSWDVSNIKIMFYTFEDCPTQPKWYK